MKEGQEKIYYLVAPTLAAAAASPHLEVFRQKGIEVLLLGDAVDNWVVTSLPEFDGKRLQSVAQGSPDFGALQDEAEQQAAEKAAAEFAELVGRLKAALDGKAWDVRVTSRLTTSPACIVANEPDIDFSLAHRLRGSGLPSQPVLEINPEHPLVARLSRDPDDPRLAEWAHVLYSQAVLTLGARIDDPAAFVGQLNDLLVTPDAREPTTRREDPAAAAAIRAEETTRPGRAFPLPYAYVRVPIRRRLDQGARVAGRARGGRGIPPPPDRGHPDAAGLRPAAASRRAVRCRV